MCRATKKLLQTHLTLHPAAKQSFAEGDPSAEQGLPRGQPGTGLTHPAASVLQPNGMKRVIAFARRHS